MMTTPPVMPVHPHTASTGCHRLFTMITLVTETTQLYTIPAPVLAQAKEERRSRKRWLFGHRVDYAAQVQITTFPARVLATITEAKKPLRTDPATKATYATQPVNTDHAGQRILSFAPA